MITEKEIDEVLDLFAADYNSAPMIDLVNRILKERDTALQQLEQAREYILTAKGDVVVDQLKEAKQENAKLERTFKLWRDEAIHQAEIQKTEIAKLKAGKI